MKFTLSWLKDHLDTDADLATIVDTLTRIGLEVEAIDDRSAFAPFTIARVLKAERHPDADRLRVLKVDGGPEVNGGEPLQVVCGAPNARAGLVGALALPGTYVPGIDVTLGRSKIRGVESMGMMCSERELELSDAHDGIIDLPESVLAEHPVGSSFAAYAGLDDPVIEIGLTPNRPDCTGVYGIARDLAAAGLGTLKDGSVEAVEGEGEPGTKVRIDVPDLCPGFALRQVSGVRNGPSPEWMQRRLLAVGLRPISALVDITNYVTMDRGRPLHVFDAAKVEGDLVVRRAREGETILALDGKEYALTPEMCVIADANGPESIAGIMGGERSGCTDETTDVLIESALWNPSNIARTGRTLGIVTDARYRFERGVDPGYMVDGMEYATRLVIELCGGTASEPEVAGFEPTDAREIRFPVSEIERLTGVAVPEPEVIAILRRLGFGVNEPEPMRAEGLRGSVERVIEQIADGARGLLSDDEGYLSVRVPTWRPDIDPDGDGSSDSGKADLVEEVIRIHGLDKVEPTRLPKQPGVAPSILTPMQRRREAVRRSLAARGMMEAVTWSFIDRDAAEAFGGGADGLRLLNPIASDMSDMRPSILPSLLKAAARNAARGRGDVALFEIANVYEGTTLEAQQPRAAGVRRGTAKLIGSGRHWNGDAGDVGWADAKADAIAALEAAGAPVDRLQIERGGADWLHPGRSGTLKLGPKVVLARFGEFHPALFKRLDVSGPICGFEVMLDAIPFPKRKGVATKPPLETLTLQPVRRDFAFAVDREVAVGDLLRAVRGADKALIEDANVFDVFEGGNLDQGRKSVAVEVTLQPREATLTDERIETVSNAIVSAVEKAVGGTLR